MTVLSLSAVVAGLAAFSGVEGCSSFRSTASVVTPWATLFDVMTTDNYVSTDPVTVGLYRLGVQPLMEATGYAYTGTENSDVVAGHSLIAALRQEVGLNALAYIYDGESDAPSVVFSFRGTFSAADNCANEIFFLGGERSDACIAAFSEDDLDYITQADTFVQDTMESLDLASGSTVRLLFTGHSLGASMAGYMSAYYQTYSNRGYMRNFYFRSAAFTFGSPGFLSVVAAEEDRNVYSVGCHVHVYNPYDPVVLDNVDNQLGRQCPFSTEETPLPDSCAACYSGTTSECGACRDDTHNFQLYVDLTFAPTTTTPVCA